jgi:hypothetical protein
VSSESLWARRLEVPHLGDQLHLSLLIALPLIVAVCSESIVPYKDALSITARLLLSLLKPLPRLE